MSFKELGAERVFQSVPFNVNKVHLESPTGEKYKRLVVEVPNAVAVVAEVNEEVLMIKQYRATVGYELLELPAGKIDPGESAVEAGRRELKEETGYEADSLSELISYYVSPGYTTERITIVVAHSMKYLGKNLQGVEEKASSIIPVDIVDIPQFIGDGTIMDGKTILALSMMYL
jgi:ADP-ribose pyrophosphatase